nr:hypothetical protein [Tanacetum cinerariifolium]
METKYTLSSCSNSEAQQMQQIQDKAKKSCMVSFRQLHSHLKRLSQNDLQGTRTESGFKRAFTTLSGQDIKTFTGTIFLNVEQLEKQLDKEDFQEIGSMAAFIYTQLAIPEFRDTLIQHLESIKKSINERAQHKREYDSWVNERHMQIIEENIDMSKAVRHNQKSRLQAADQEMMHMIMMQILDPYMMKSQWLSSNDMVHNHYLGEAKKKTQERSRNSEPSLMPSARSQSTANGSKPKPRSNTQTSRNWPASKSSFATTKTGFKDFSTDEQGMTSDHNSSELGLHDHSNEQSSSKVVPPADKTNRS